MRTTEILVTVGPSSHSPSFVGECEDYGVSLFRINLSHTPLAEVADRIHELQSWTQTPICLDSEGAQIRSQYLSGDVAHLEPGSRVKIHFDEVLGDSENLSFSPNGIAAQFRKDDVVRIDFNGASIRIMEVGDNAAIAEVEMGGTIGSNKAADIDRELELAAFTEKDSAAIRIGLELGICDFALSFASSEQAVESMRRLCGPKARIISKIESRLGLRNLKPILAKTDAILIDRGDLSRQVDVEKIPFLQRRIISTARADAVPVYVATNLLETMVTQRHPTRAEMNDIVSTLLMGANGLVLAAETAIGKYPLEALQTARRVADLTDKWTESSTVDDVLRF